MNNIDIKQTFLSEISTEKDQGHERDMVNLNYAVDILSSEISHFIKLDVIQQELQNLITLKSDINRRARKLNIFQDDNLFTAYKLGILKTFLAILESNEEQNFDKDVKYYDLIAQNQKYENFLIILYTKNSINHGDLANLMNMSKSALTNMVRKIDDIGLFKVERRGKYKYYYSNYKTKEVYRKYFDKKANKLYSQNEVYDIINIFIKIILDELESDAKINSNVLLKRLLQSNNELTYYRKDFKSSVQKLVKSINSKIEKDYIDCVRTETRIFELNYKSYDDCDIIKIRGDFND